MRMVCKMVRAAEEDQAGAAVSTGQRRSDSWSGEAAVRNFSTGRVAEG